MAVGLAEAAVEDAMKWSVVSQLAVTTASLVALAACASTWQAPKGYYSDYHNYIATQIEHALIRDSSLPPNPAAAYANCYADYAVSQILPPDLKTLNEAARGGTPAPIALVNEAQRRFYAGLGTTQESQRSALGPFCRETEAKYPQLAPVLLPSS